MKRIRCSAIFLAWALLFLGMTAFSYAADQALIEAAKKEGEIAIYDSIDRKFQEPLGKAFKEMYKLGGNFKVTFTRKATGQLIQMVEAEKMAGKSLWDIISHSDEGTFLRWIDEGMLMKYQPPNLGNIPEVFRDPYGCRVSAYIGMSSIAIHKKRVPEKEWPKTYKELMDPKWKGRLGVADPNKSGPSVMFTKYMLDLYGWDYVRKLGRNQIILTGGNPALEEMLLSGEIDVAICPNEYSILVRIKDGEADLKMIYPEEGAGFFVQWRAINKNAPHPNAAKLWNEFSVSDEGQKHLSDEAARYPTNKNVRLAFPRPELKFYKVDWQWLKVNKDDMCKKFIDEVNKGRAEGKK